MRWGIEKRLEFIEFRLFWEGKVNRADIMEQFGISMPQASKDLSLYELKAPGNLSYDKSEKRYLASTGFKPVFLVPEAATYLAQLRSTSSRSVELEDSWLSNLPDHDSMPVPHRRVAVGVMRSVLSAVREKTALEIHYQSMNPSRPEPEWRWISPHAFAFDGLRWHARAYCHSDRKFKDFILSRVLSTRGTGNAAANGTEDRFWHERLDVLLRPNPALGRHQQDIVAQDYKMEHEQIAISVRKAMVYYFQKRLRLDVGIIRDDPHETPVVLANPDEVERVIVEARA